MSKELLAVTVKELAEWPGATMREEEQGKHRKLVLSFNGQSRLVVFANTPSDQRAIPNHLAVVRRELRGMGAVKSHLPTRKPDRPIRTFTPATQSPFKNLETPMKPTNKIEAVFSLIADLRYGEMLALAEIFRDAATDTGLRRSMPNDWARMLHGNCAPTAPNPSRRGEMKAHAIAAVAHAMIDLARHNQAQKGPPMTDPTEEHRCPHGIRHPWQCDDCDRENPPPMTNPTPEALRIWQDALAAYDTVEAFNPERPLATVLAEAENAAARIITDALAVQEARIAAAVQQTQIDTREFSAWLLDTYAEQVRTSAIAGNMDPLEADLLDRKFSEIAGVLRDTNSRARAALENTNEQG